MILGFVSCIILTTPIFMLGHNVQS